MIIITVKIVSAWPELVSVKAFAQQNKFKAISL